MLLLPQAHDVKYSMIGSQKIMINLELFQRSGTTLSQIIT